MDFRYLVKREAKAVEYPSRMLPNRKCPANAKETNREKYTMKKCATLGVQSTIVWITTSSRGFVVNDLKKRRIRATKLRANMFRINSWLSRMLLPTVMMSFRTAAICGMLMIRCNSKRSKYWPLTRQLRPLAMHAEWVSEAEVKKTTNQQQSNSDHLLQPYHAIYDPFSSFHKPNQCLLGLVIAPIFSRSFFRSFLGIYTHGQA